MVKKIEPSLSGFKPDSLIQFKSMTSNQKLPINDTEQSTAIPSHFDAITRDLIQRLLVHDWFRRLGCFRGGAADVKRHKFFREIDWGSLKRREVTAPIRPKPKHAGDPSLFEIYPADSSHNKAPTPEILKIFEEW
ncbi:hypothetical protein P9112_014685 [Eukaryota sp. TZLM1-RC]